MPTHVAAGLRIVELTGDSDESSMASVQEADVIMTTVRVYVLVYQSVQLSGMCAKPPPLSKHILCFRARVGSFCGGAVFTLTAAVLWFACGSWYSLVVVAPADIVGVVFSHTA